jgi:hypothetical protein
MPRGRNLIRMSQMKNNRASMGAPGCQWNRSRKVNMYLEVKSVPFGQQMDVIHEQREGS